MRTTLTLNEDVAAYLKAVERKTGLSRKDLVNRALQKGLSQMEHPPKVKPYQAEPRAMGLRPGLSYDNVEELLGIIEGEIRK